MSEVPARRPGVSGTNAAGGGDPNQGRDKGRFPQDLINKFLDNQTEELSLRRAELELERQKDNNGFQVAQTHIEIQAQDRRHEREVEAASRSKSYVLYFGICSLVVVTVLVALFLNKDEIAKEIVKAVVFVAVGFIGGLGTAKLKSSEKASVGRGSDTDG